ncbi:alanine racemase [Bacillus sp. TS-2]|nr:alanine racemase [Bacillus sp. TS-2]
MRNARAWAPVSFSNLKHNLSIIQEIIPSQTQIMAVIKADAYGHGIKEVSEQLYLLGVKAFAVATLHEGMEVRKTLLLHDDIEILILGRTDCFEADLLEKYRLTQTLSSHSYALELERYATEHSLTIDTHLKIDTGMHRLGYDWDQIDIIKQAFYLKHIKIKGIYSHLSRADSFSKEDVDWTHQQIDRFNNCLVELKDYPYGKTHLQNSGGIINYSHLQYDYVRPGIMLYGSPSGETHSIGLKPTVQLKATIASIKHVNVNQSIGYGRSYISKKPMKIASVTIGYADGYPRSLSGQNAPVIVNGQMASLIGNVCMDQIIIDVTHIESVNEGDIVTLIGEDQQQSISIADLANLAQTITNDLLCQFSLRVKRLYTSNSWKDVQRFAQENFNC